MQIIAVLFWLPSFLVTLDFLRFLFTDKRFNGPSRAVLDVVIIILYPLLYLTVFDGKTNDCCYDTATFSPDHKLTIYILILICILTYFYSSLKEAVASPVIEVLVNVILLLGIAFNVAMSFHVEQPMWLLDNLPVCMLFILQLIGNQKKFIALHQSEGKEETKNAMEKLAWKILTLKPIAKFPVLLLLCLPLLICIICILLLFGQKPDSIIRAFTDTYKHGFSQLDHLCDNVDCGDHFLCSVAAGGHRELVRPIRYGERKGGKIICNRQLLIANAFEELIEQKLPGMHRMIRKNYNKVGAVIHRYYFTFNNRYVADAVYLFMKPLEFFFLFILYTADQRPEDRIAQQYLNKSHRRSLRSK
jgi:hypothetical protein